MTSAHLIRLGLLIAALALACSGGGDRRGGGGGGSEDEGSELASTFLTSSTGTSTILVGDTIQFEVGLTTELDRNYSTFFFSLTGDAMGNEMAMGPSWAGVDHLVTAWSWNYRAGTGNVKFPTDGVIAPADNSMSTSLPVPVSIGYGWFGQNRTGTGATNVIGTVTITADTLGDYEGGAFFVNGLDVLTGADGDDTVLISTGAFTVAP